MTLTLRPYEPRDAEPTLEVFRRAIRQTAAADYTPEQVEAWAGGVQLDAWAARRAGAGTWVAEIDGALVGFTDIDGSGYIDMMFVDPTAGRRGVAGALFATVREIAADGGARELTVNASRTARPFFERQGFTVVAEQQVERNGSTLTNFRMHAPLAPAST